MKAGVGCSCPVQTAYEARHKAPLCSGAMQCAPLRIRSAAGGHGPARAALCGAERLCQGAHCAADHAMGEHAHGGALELHTGGGLADRRAVLQLPAVRCSPAPL